MAGTPGVGKSKICAEIAKKCSMKWQDVSKIAKDKGFVEEYDENLECPVLDEDKVSVLLLSNTIHRRNVSIYHIFVHS